MSSAGSRFDDFWPDLAALFEAQEALGGASPRARSGDGLVFDYVRSDGAGTEIEGRAQERLVALRYLAECFQVVEGAIPLDGGHVARTVARKPS